MRRKNRDYKPLARFTDLNLFSNTERMRLGKDHLLIITSAGFSENYLRLYYRDIQSIVVRKTMTGLLVNIALAVLCALCGYGIIVGGDARFFGELIGVLVFLPLAARLIVGPTCVWQIRTAAHTEGAARVAEVRSTMRAIGRLQPLIEAAQDRLSVAEIDRLWNAAPASVRRGPQRADESPVRPYHGLFHAITFRLLLVVGALSLAGVFFRNIVVTVAGALVLVGLLVSVLGALVEYYGNERATRPPWLLWGTFAFVSFTFLYGFAYFVAQATSYAVTMTTLWDIITRIFSSIRAERSVFLLVFFANATACSVGLGLAGLMAMREFGGTRFVASAPAPRPRQSVALQQSEKSVLTDL